MKDEEQVIVTVRVDRKTRQEFRSLLMRDGITVQDFLADTITEYVKENKDK